MVFFIVQTFSAQVFVGEKSSLRFFTKTIAKDIDALNSNIKPILNFSDGTVHAEALVSQFIFESARMQDHYNEKFIESAKFPFAIFVGKIKEQIDYAKNGTSAVTITGTLTVHGVEKAREISATITIRDGKVTIDSKFTVAFADHAIKSPTLFGKKMAETTAVTFHSEMIPYVKK